MNFDSGLLLSSDFRKSFVSKLQEKNSETLQLKEGLKNYKFTKLNELDKLLLAHDLSFIFTKEFYDFDHGSLFLEKSLFLRSDETLLFFFDYLLYFSFISSSYDRPIEADAILNDISSLNSRKVFFNALKEPLSPYLFITFIHDLIDSINLGSPSHDSSSIEYEMCRQLVINAKELSQLDKFIVLYKCLLEKIKSQYKNAKITVTTEMENTYMFYFAHAFFNTIVYPSSDFKDPSFKGLTKNIYDRCKLNSQIMNPIIDQFSSEKDLLSYHTYLFQRFLCIQKSGCWVNSAKEKKIFQYPAQVRLTIMSKKIGELIGDTVRPIGNTVVKITFPSDSKISEKVTVSFKYNNKEYSKQAFEGSIELVFPCFKDIPLNVSFSYKNKKPKKKNSVSIASLQNPASNEITKKIKIHKKEYSILISHNFYNYDQPINDLTVRLDQDPTHLFNLVLDEFIHQYFKLNGQFVVVNRGEDEFEDSDDEENGKSLFMSSNYHIKAQDISGRAFPVDFWLFLCDLSIKYSIPSSYFFSKITEKLTDCWCNSQAYINLYCIVLYSFYFTINKSEHLKKDETKFSDTMNTIREKCLRLLMSQLAKPEIYQRPSVTSLILLLSLSNDNNASDLNKVLENVFLSSINNINQSIYNTLKYEESDTECTSIELFNKITPPPDFHVGPNNLPLCQVEIESLRKAADLVLYRCRSISLFYLESFLPSFANIGQNIMNDLMLISIDISKAFTQMKPKPDQKNLVYFVTIFQQLYQLFDKPEKLNPAVIFNDSIWQWIFESLNSTIDMVERSVTLDNFEKRSEKTKTSDSFHEIFLFFRQGFDFIQSLNFKPDEVNNKFCHFLSICSSICTNYIELLLSMASKKFRNSFKESLQTRQQTKTKSPFPSWCPDLTSPRDLTFENMIIMINNIASIRTKWLKYLAIYKDYFPDQPQIQAAVKAMPKRRRSLKSAIESSSFLLLEESEGSSENLIKEQLVKDPCFKLTTKMLFMMNFLRLDLTYVIIALLNNQMWDNSFLNKTNIKQLRMSFFIENSQLLEQNTISNVFNQIFDEFKKRIQKVKDCLLVPLYIKCIPQLVRAVEDGIFECMIPLAFSTKSKNVFWVLSNKIESLYADILNFINESGFDKEIVDKCADAFRFMPYIRNYIHLSQKEAEDELKKEKANFNGDNTNIILLSIVIQVVTAVPLPKAINPNFTFISLD